MHIANDSGEHHGRRTSPLVALVKSGQFLMERRKR
jgi:hypothetical protein